MLFRSADKDDLVGELTLETMILLHHRGRHDLCSTLTSLPVITICEVIYAINLCSANIPFPTRNCSAVDENIVPPVSQLHLKKVFTRGGEPAPEHT